ncbi:MAG: hypothetical protein QW734_04620 [Candidatus Bathyarchaeia archaeon]
MPWRRLAYSDDPPSTVGTYYPFSVTFTESGAVTVYTPSSGKKAQVYGFFLYVDSEVVCELRFETSNNIIGGVPFKGSVGMNLNGLTPPTGDIDEGIAVYASGACTVKGWVCVSEL